MALREPESMDELVYFTRRQLKDGEVMAWVYRGDCPECGKGKMGKPIDPKTKKVKTRAKEYECPECHHTVQKEEYEDTLTAEAKYTCPHCGKEGESTAPYKRKSVRVEDEESGKMTTMKVLRFSCEHCGKNVDIAQKMKDV